MITVVDDSSERGVKSLATDFQSSATFIKNFDGNLQVIGKSRLRRPNLRKRPHT